MPLHPHSITTGPDGALWFTAIDTNQLGRITAGGAITIYDLPPGTGEGGQSMLSVTSGPNGTLWIADVFAIIRADLDGLVPVDVKPGSCVNPINARSRGKLPVALGGTATIDALQIDPRTVRLGESRLYIGKRGGNESNVRASGSSRQAPGSHTARSS